MSSLNYILPAPTNEEEFLAQREYRIKTLHNCGIYIIQNKVNNHIYIGSSKNIKQRFYDHKSQLRHNKHSNPYLQNAWNKYREENFEFFIIEYHSYPEKILKREAKHIQLYNPEYNINRVDENLIWFQSDETKRKIGIKSKEKFIKNPKLREDFINRVKLSTPWNKGKTKIYSKEVIKKMSDAAKLRGAPKHSKEIIQKIADKNSKPILQYDLEGNFIKEWKSSAEAARFYNITNSGNFSTATKKGIKLYNSYWRKKL